MPSDAFGRSLLQRAGSFAPRYLRTQLSLSSVSLVGGFVFDAVTLKRIDMLWENLWVVVHLLVVALCVFWVTHDESFHAEREAGAAKLDSWLVYLLQFFFGGLLSTFMVFYFRSGTFWVSWPFYLLLTAAFIANEKLKTWYARLEYQLSIFFLSLFCFMIFILPVVLHADRTSGLYPQRNRESFAVVAFRRHAASTGQRGLLPACADRLRLHRGYLRCR